MSNDITYNLVFTAAKKAILLQVKSYLEDKKSRWDNRGDKTAADLLKETGLKNAAEVVSWGFEFGKIQQSGDFFSVEVTSWANENSLGNIWISGPDGELYFVLEKFPELDISGSFRGDYGRGSVYGSELDYESWNDDENEETEDENEGLDKPLFVELNPEHWESARAKNQALAPTLVSVDGPGHLVAVVLPQDVAMPFCSIPAGSFKMGSPEDEEGRDAESENQAEVTLSRPFWLAKTEVTQAQWEAVMCSNPSRCKGPNLPVGSVSWNDAKVFLAKLNQNKILPRGWEFALPTEAQWEYACRAGESGPYSGGGLEEVAWFPDNSQDKAHEVGLKKANAWGLHDMLGNVAEWCADEFSLELIGGKDPVGSDPESKWGGHVMRGGSYCAYGIYDNQVNEWRAAMRHFEGDEALLRLV